jgi:hypothetical protein
MVAERKVKKRGYIPYPKPVQIPETEKDHERNPQQVPIPETT